MSQPAILTLLKDGETISQFQVDGEVLLGRAPESTIHVSDRAISREHALFRVVGDQVQVEKRSEFSPLIVNGSECTSALLKSGDLITAGAYVLRLDHSAPDAAHSLEASAEIAKDLGTGTGTGGDSQGGIQQEESGSNSGVNADVHSDSDKTSAISLESSRAGAMLNPDGSENPEGSAENLKNNTNGSFGESAQLGEIGFQADAEDRTRLTPMAQVAVKLVFPVGTANVEEFALTQDSITIGRSKECDVVLNDKKSSRKNAVIRKSGVTFIIKDMNSANGTFINGVRIEEQELSSEDVIRIGNVEFVFSAQSMEYMAQEKDLQLPVVSEIGAFDAPADPLAGLGSAPDAQNPISGDIAGIGEQAIPGIQGTGLPVGGKQTLLERFKGLPKRTQIIYGLAAAAVLWWALSDDEAPVLKKAPAPAAKKTEQSKTAVGTLAFELLSPEQQRFVEAQHSLAFDYYRNKEYDKAIFEISKIFTLVSDYKDAREIERYAKEGKRKMEALEDERRKKEEEQILKAKIAQLIEEARQRMEKKQFEQAKELFIQILGLDPDNVFVNQWNKDIQAYEEQKQLQEQQKQVESDINQHGMDILKEAKGLKSAGKFHEAIEVAEKISDIGVSDPTIVPASKKLIAECLAAIARRRNPVLKAAKMSEDAGEFSKAFALFRKATKIDPAHSAGYAGMNRIRKVLHDSARVAYQEAILAESISDFTQAKKLFQECLSIAPVEDEYHGRAQRKLSRYLKKKDDKGALTTSETPTSGSESEPTADVKDASEE